jgi:RNA polymerase sigma-70 factor, ECF subfamily
MEAVIPEIQLFNRIQSDDRKALNELFSFYYRQLCQFACSYVALPEAEEIVSDIFFNLWKQRKELAIEKSLKAYLYISVRNSCLRALGKEKYEFESIENYENAASLTSQSDPYQSLHMKEMTTYIDAAIDLLPVRCRQIFIMNRYDGLKYREIAEILSISEKTVENQIVKALDVLRTSFQKYQDHIEHPRLIFS